MCHQDWLMIRSQRKTATSIDPPKNTYATKERELQIGSGRNDENVAAAITSLQQQRRRRWTAQKKKIVYIYKWTNKITNENNTQRHRQQELGMNCEMIHAKCIWTRLKAPTTPTTNKHRTQRKKNCTIKWKEKKKTREANTTTIRTILLKVKWSTSGWSTSSHKEWERETIHAWLIQRIPAMLRCYYIMHCTTKLLQTTLLWKRKFYKRKLAERNG